MHSEKPITYVILDCETTGLHAEYGDRIIEVALLAVTFDSETRTLREVARLETLVNPEVPLDEKISLITGITNEDLKSAPLWPQVQSQVEDFLKQVKQNNEIVLVGHNVAFDVRFLQTAGVQVEQYKCLDTLDFALLFEENGVSLSLESLTSRHEITHDSHRAMGDVLATKIVLEKYLQQITLLSPLVQTMCAGIFQKSDWTGKNLFCLSEKIDASTAVVEFKKSLTANISGITAPVGNKKRSQDLSPAQQVIYQTVQQQLASEQHTLINLAPGNGRTVAILQALVDFSTTKQEKIFYVYPRFNAEIEEALVSFAENGVMQWKDQRQLISLTKLLHWIESAEYFTNDETVFLLKIIFWLFTSSTGYAKELSLPPTLRAFLPFITGPEHADADEIFLGAYEQQQAHASIFLVSVFDFLADPERAEFIDGTVLAFENGNQLEDQLLSARTTTLSLNRLLAVIQEAGQVFRRQTQVNMAMLEKITLLQEKIPFLFGFLGMYANKKIQDSSEKTLILTPKQTGTLDFEKTKHTLEETIALLTEAQQELFSFTKYTEQTRDMDRTVQVLQSVLTPVESSVTYVEMRYDEEVVIKRVELNIEDFLSGIMQHKKVLLFCSKTMNLAQRLNLQNFHTIEVSTPEQKNITSYLMEDLQVANSTGYLEQLRKIVATIAEKRQEKVVFILGSNAVLEQVVLPLASQWQEQNIPFIAQKISGGERKVLEKYASSNYSSLFFCTTDFFLKMNPRLLQADLFVIQKLPFVYTKNLLDSFRKTKYSNEFMEYALPKTLVRFEDAMGQIQKGVALQKKVLVLDNKIAKEEYGKYFRELLPDSEKVFYMQQEELDTLLS